MSRRRAGTNSQPADCTVGFSLKNASSNNPAAGEVRNAPKPQSGHMILASFEVRVNRLCRD